MEIYDKCKKCKKLLLDNDIMSNKDFLKWSLKNHPDKGGSYKKFQDMSTCNDAFNKDKICKYECDPEYQKVRRGYKTKSTWG